jgi:hypothetical protein
MPFNIDAKAGPDVARLAADTRTEFERLRTIGVTKVTSVPMGDLPLDGSRNLAIASGTSNGIVPVFWDGSGWFFMDGTPLT